MWIRSQDKKVLIKCEDIEISGTDIVNITRYGVAKLGKYSTEEKALKVLDKISHYVVHHPLACYQMPTDEEVY